MRKAVGDDPDEIYLAVFLSSTTDGRFHVFKPNLKSVSLMRINTLPAPDVSNITTNSCKVRFFSFISDGSR